MDKVALNTVSTALGIPPAWLDALITFESGWKPGARNPISGARGLIQFTNTTARAMGYANADDLYNKNPSDTSQLLGPVLKYLSQFTPFPSEQSLYMSVFYPAARGWDPSTFFPNNVRELNPGINTVADYVRKVKNAPIVQKGITLAGIILIAGLGFLSYNYFINPFIQKKGWEKWLPMTAQSKKQLKVVPQVVTDPES